jgi:hypothetical protein
MAASSAERRQLFASQLKSFRKSKRSSNNSHSTYHPQYEQSQTEISPVFYNTDNKLIWTLLAALKHCISDGTHRSIFNSKNTQLQDSNLAQLQISK